MEVLAILAQRDRPVVNRYNLRPDCIPAVQSNLLHRGFPQVGRLLYNRRNRRLRASEPHEDHSEEDHANWLSIEGAQEESND